MPSTLAIGTVQFGLPYGIANQTGQVSRQEVEKILGCARDAGLDTLDTAIAYGDSERLLGEVGVSTWRVITKLPALPADVADLSAWVTRQTEGSLERLRVERVGGLLLHRAADLVDRGVELYDAMATLKSRGLVEKIGVSIYAPDELERLTAHQLDLVQAPFNVFDRRLRQSGWLRCLHAAGVEVHTRSAFLQGLLLMPADRRPAQFARWSPLFARWDSWLASQGTGPLEACLAFALAEPGVDRVVVGIDSAAQLQEILRANRSPHPTVPDDLSSDDLDLINPVNWRAR